MATKHDVLRSLSSSREQILNALGTSDPKVARNNIVDALWTLRTLESALMDAELLSNLGLEVVGTIMDQRIVVKGGE